MKRTSIFLAIFSLVAVCFVTAQNKEEKKPQTWKEKAAARFGDKPTKEQKETIEDSLPSPTSKPKSPRKVLVFWRCEGFIHTSIPFGNHALKALAEKSDAFSADFADEYDVFTKENLAQFDALIFNNTTNLIPNEDQRSAILNFINGGKGIVGIHAASDNFKKWEEGIALIGGVFNGHPWNAGGTWAFKVEDPDHPLNAAFQGDGFWHKDEIYWYKPENFQGRERLRVLLSLDMSKPETTKPLEGDKWKDKVKNPQEVDVPVSWCKEVGEGRLFYTNLGHNDMTFADTMILQHMLDGIQYALGDLEADAMPSSNAKVKIHAAPAKSE